MNMPKFKLGFLGRGRDAAPTDAPPPIDSARLVELMRCFPISGKVRYFPEHRKDIVLESLVIAYGIDSHLVYTQNDIHIDNDNGAPVFTLDEDWQDHRIRDVRRFCLLLPYIGGMAGDLDYDRRVALETGGFLQRGEVLTLMSLSNNRGIPHVNAVVRKRTLLKEGYYANHAVIVLELQPDSLNHIDQRQQVRVRCAVPVILQPSEEGPGFAATLIDFSESSLRLRLDQSADLLAERKQLIVTIALPQQDRKFVLCGRVLRREADDIVLSLSSRLREDRFRDIELLDALDLKSTLLQHPSTRP